MTTFGGRISQARNRLELTRDALARQIGVSAQAVSEWELDQKYPEPPLLVPLADALSLSLDELLRDGHRSRDSRTGEIGTVDGAGTQSAGREGASDQNAEPTTAERATVLRIDVIPTQHTSGKDTVHLRLPLSVIRGALRSGADYIPELLPEKISRHMKLEDLTAMVAGATPGTVLDAFDGEDHLVIALE